MDSKVIKSAEFAGEIIELVKLSEDWRPWHYQVNCIQGGLKHSMANFHCLGDAERLWDKYTGKDVK